MLSFNNPIAFLLLLLIPIYYLLRKIKFFKKITFPAVLSDWNGSSFSWSHKSDSFLYYLSKFLFLLSLILMIFSFADPVISKQEKIYTSLGVDVFFVIDTSPSMAARDVNGTTRISSAVSSVKQLSMERDGYRFGLITLGTNASVLVPPTNDRLMFERSLSSISVGMMGNGSAIGDGISTAVYHLNSSTAPKKCVILLTDGENNAGEINPETAALLAEKNKINLYIIGIGSKGNVPIEYSDPITNKTYSGYLNSDYDSSSLRKLASIGNGIYFEALTIEELNAYLQTIAKNEDVVQKYTYKEKDILYYDKVLLVAIICLILSWIIKKDMV